MARIITLMVVAAFTVLGTTPSASALTPQPAAPDPVRAALHETDGVVHEHVYDHFIQAPTPRLAGAPQVGAELNAESGTWSPNSDSLTYQWTRSGTPILGASKSSYTVRAEDIGHSLAVTTRATKQGYEPTERTSIATQPVVATGAHPQIVTFNTRLPVSSTTPGWNDRAPEENPVYSRPTALPSSIVMPNGVNETSAFVSAGAYTTGRPVKPNHIVLHHTATDDLDVAIGALSGWRYVSTSYVVKDNTLVSMVPEQDSPWTNGRWTSNLYSVTFEMVNAGRRSNGTWVSPSASTRETTAWAMARAAQRWGLELPLQYGMNVFGHRDVSFGSTACPGELDVQAVVNRANQILSEREVRGSIGELYYSLGGTSSLLVTPESRQYCGLKDDGCFQLFRNGWIFFSPSTGIHVVKPEVRALWEKYGVENGPLGYPTSDPSSTGSTYTQTFQGGTVTVTNGVAALQ